MPPVEPMLAKAAKSLPRREGMVYEPKWDGFRCIVFRDGDEIELGSRNERPLTRYFPELLEPLRANLPTRAVVDGEIVIVGSGGLDFEALLQRIHPAASRVASLAERTPASFVAFDLLALGDDDLCDVPFATRRHRLEEALAGTRPPVHLTPATTDPDVAGDWFARFEGAGLDGVVAKDPALPYRPGQRLMTKIKHLRTADCVVAGFRWRDEPVSVASLLLGLFDGDGTLHHVGVTSSFTNERRRQLVDELAPQRLTDPSSHPWTGPVDGHTRIPGGLSRWNAGRDLSWVPLHPSLVCEVAYDHLQGTRFRHATTFQRWRPDRDAASCTYDQLETAVPLEIERVFGTAG